MSKEKLTAAAVEQQQQLPVDKAAAKIQAGFRGYRVRKQLQEERKAKEIGADALDDTMEEQPGRALEEKSATKIQAGVRGFLVRKRQQVEQVAATRIQAGFRGFRTRKLLKQNGQ
ncbi:uncharacterized protein KIAA1683 homolog [Copidosoma floridanum]|uniref:uncharacterized protein KIAA1683 homolog n=1 Tax=Copidosoma floridanum TaxID=29053 RepID=UPI0006C9C069|nr:uncharacterized protein KIAA1683 homolog [Copidosoma floridanum]